VFYRYRRHSAALCVLFFAWLICCVVPVSVSVVFYECFIIVKISFRFLNSGAWPDSISNLYSERVSRVISEAGCSWAIIPGPGQILYQISTQNVSLG
jgi:hypothetical protein